uniref:Uncharacterized protein n=1 Tax=Rhizophagus irregularis (strain DAOM 181602 / DAOM 197198 / MUCL 43194) TaxID=747089 RepID=U9TN63_RHIID
MLSELIIILMKLKESISYFHVLVFNWDGYGTLRAEVHIKINDRLMSFQV